MLRVSPTEFADAFSSVISEEDEIIVVHSNVFSFGWMDDLVAGITDSILQRLHPEQTLLMPTFTLSVCDTGRYHHSRSKSETGALSEYFRGLPGVDRTPCFLNSFCGAGPTFQALAAHSRGETVWGEGSIYQALYDRNARIVGLGEQLSVKGSIFHYAEQRARVPYRYFKTFRAFADFGEGEEEISKEMFVRRRDLPTAYDFSPVITELQRRGAFATARVGMGFIESLRAREAVDTMLEVLECDSLAVLVDPGAFQKAAQAPSFVFLGSSNLDLTAETFKSCLNETCGEDGQVVPVPFNQYRQELLNPESDVRIADPDYVIFLERAEDLFGSILKDPVAHRDAAADVVQDEVENFISFIRTTRAHLSGKFVVADFAPSRPSPLGNLDPAMPFGQGAIINLANKILREALAGLPDVYVLDFGAVLQEVGRAHAFSGKYWFAGRIPFSKQFSVGLGYAIAGIRLAIEGRTAKLLVVDLDNCLWGGLAGEEGLEGVMLGGDYPGNMFKEFQCFLKALSSRGIALGICSKNNENDAIRIIREHPEMVLKEEDFAAIRINWNDKAFNIESMCRSVSLGTESVLFVDDNPVERAWVRRFLPDCVVPDMPKDISKWVDFLARLPSLGTVRLTPEDMKRSRHYVQRRRMEVNRDSFATAEDFLRDLDMEISITRYGEPFAARVLQLIAKTNQFNTTTKRYGRMELEALINEGGAEVFAVALRDKYFEKEILAVVVLMPSHEERSSYVIDTFIMSCRAAGRNLETALIGWIANHARRRGKQVLVGLYRSSERNKPVEQLYPRHGFQPTDDGSFELDLSGQHRVEIPPYFKIAESEDCH